MWRRPPTGPHPRGITRFSGAGLWPGNAAPTAKGAVPRTGKDLAGCSCERQPRPIRGPERIEWASGRPIPDPLDGATGRWQLLFPVSCRSERARDTRRGIACEQAPTARTRQHAQELRLTLRAGACCHAPFIGTFVLIIVAVALILVVLAQRAKSDGGMAAMGGGMMESTFGPDTSNVLSKFTIRATIVFFVVSFLLYLGYVHIRSHGAGGQGTLPNISAQAGLPPVPAGSPTPAAAQPAAPTAPVPAATNAAPDAAAKTGQGGTTTKAP